jgi:hypothetical protein
MAAQPVCRFGVSLWNALCRHLSDHRPRLTGIYIGMARLVINASMLIASKAGHVLDNADPFTEAVAKGDKTLYRARFAGFQQKDEAEAACKQLKLHDIDCITIKN